MGKRLGFFAAIALTAVSSFAVTTKDMTSGLTPENLAAVLTGAGITITNVKVTGANASIGTFTGGLADGLTIDEGVIMSTGDIKTAAGPNTSEGTTGSMGTPGDTTLDTLIKPLVTHDAIIIEFDAVTASPTFSIRYIFASEEYKEWVGSQYNDVFAFFVDGQNIALVPGGSEPVAVNTINHKKNTGLYNDNPAFSNNFGTSFDGFTTELTAVAGVAAGTPHHIKLAIADASDTALDSAVFLAKGGISGSGGAAAAVVPDFNEISLANVDTNDMNVTVYGVPDDQTAVMSASGLPEDSSVTFTPNGAVGPNTPIYRMHVNIGPDTPAGEYPLIIQAQIGDASVYGQVNVVVDCTPPMILSLPGNQPASTSVTSGSPATLQVKATGSKLFHYQWYAGHTGSTAFPIDGANSAVLTTSEVTTPSDFWVRVWNACGSIDSQTATVTPQ